MRERRREGERSMEEASNSRSTRTACRLHCIIMLRARDDFNTPYSELQHDTM